jgi:diguanylate cyclase (GGDEF)-like protein
LSSSNSSRTGPTRVANADQTELDWLLQISKLATPPKGPPQLQDRSERLARLMSASVQHFDCALGALLIPQKNLRLVRTSNCAAARSAEEALSRLEGPLLNRIRRKKQPMLLNGVRGSSASDRALKLLVVPVAGDATASEGALLFLRLTDSPAFTHLQLSVARHLSRQFYTLIDTEIDLATGLYTRRGVQRHVESSHSGPEGPPGTHAVICIDIDRLHIVNKVSGFEAGDALVARVATLLREPPVPSDAAAARISGNEFVIVLPNANTEVAERTARALQQLAAHLPDEGASVQQPVSLSCGIALFGPPTEFQRGLVLAELACQMAKDRGRGRVEVYQEDDASMIRRHTDIVVIQQLHEALREDRLTLFAQRIMPLQRHDELGGYELLLRSKDQLRENHAPAALLSAALRTGLAPELDLWVVEHAISEALPYRSDLLAANVSLSINIAGQSLTDENFLERVREAIRQSDLPPALIMFEITETVAVLSLAKALRFIRELRAIGCRFALDDFGTGANSLKNLTNLPLDRVKIDGSFVSDILTNHQSAAMVRGIVSLARDLGITTVAEYAENDLIIEQLREFGVEYAQGYGVEKPRAVAQVFRELRARQGARGLDSSVAIR